MSSMRLSQSELVSLSSLSYCIVLFYFFILVVTNMAHHRPSINIELMNKSYTVFLHVKYDKHTIQF